MQHEMYTVTKTKSEYNFAILFICLTLKDRAPIRTLSDRVGALRAPPLYLGNYYR